ncbi:MAG TPA: ABC transporter substrate-binding protein [Candidatus Binatia bacterium]|nr:ABC transporter substrate-binding protein [Candidatus Binatia bacterium]
MSKMPVVFAGCDYDRVRALIDGRIRPDGIDLNYLALPGEEVFYRMLRHREFDAAEVSFSSYLVSKSLPEQPFVAIPVFPSRAFRHSCIYVNTASGIERPEDLAGKRVAAPEYQMTAGLWIRGILSDEYGVPVESMRHFTGGEEQPGRPEKVKLSLPETIRIEPIGEDQTLSTMLEKGEIDALFAPRAPSSYARNPAKVRRLFEDYKSAEQDYFRRTSIFPIMHTVVIRRALYERHPWIAMSLFKAFTQAQAIAYADLKEIGLLSTMLPWLVENAEEVRRLMGEDFWPYGLERNRKTLETFARYSHEQGLSPRMYAPEDLFAPETLDEYRV